MSMAWTIYQQDKDFNFTVRVRFIIQITYKRDNINRYSKVALYKRTGRVVIFCIYTEKNGSH